MAHKIKHILFVVEGIERDLGIINNLSAVFFNHRYDITCLCIPADMNIYMLYNLLKKDDFETDVVEVLREKVPLAKEKLDGKARGDSAEVYFFFDFDEHANNVYRADNLDVLKEMLEKLDNETEMGKLYISYPMIEAARDYVANHCETISGDCFRSQNEFGSYKNDSGKNQDHNDIRKYDYVRWNEIIMCYVNRVSCLFELNFLDRNLFVKTITPLSLFEKEKQFYLKDEKVFILSCLPEFLIDYSEKYWINAIKNRKKPFKKRSCKFK